MAARTGADGYSALTGAAPWPRDRFDGADPERVFELREKVGLLTASGGDPAVARQGLVPLLFDRERCPGPHHPRVRRLRRTLGRLNAHRTAAATARPIPGNPHTTGWAPQ